MSKTNKLNTVPELLRRAKSQWLTERPDLPVEDASLVGMFLGVASNLADVGIAKLSEFDLRQTEHDVLACLRRQGRPYAAIPNTLLEEVKITSGALTTCVNRLIQRKLVIRVVDKQDQRSKPIVLTEKGKLLIDEVTSVRFELAAQLIESFSDEEKATLEKLLAKVSSAL